MSVAWQQGGLLKFCGEKGIHVSAWSPLGNLGAGFWGTPGILEIPLLKDIAQVKHKTIAQVNIFLNLTSMECISIYSSSTYIYIYSDACRSH